MQNNNLLLKNTHWSYLWALPPQYVYRGVCIFFLFFLNTFNSVDIVLKMDVAPCENRAWSNYPKRSLNWHLLLWTNIDSAPSWKYLLRIPYARSILRTISKLLKVFRKNKKRKKSPHLNIHIYVCHREAVWAFCNVYILLLKTIMVITLNMFLFENFIYRHFYRNYKKLCVRIVVGTY